MMLDERVVRFRPRAILTVIGVVLAAAIVIEVLWVTRSVIIWVLIALFLAMALNPAVEVLVRFLGRDLVRSTNFVVHEKNGVFSFAGLGWGHGAGLCQWGTKGMAEAGENYRSILSYYYKDTNTGKLSR